MYIRYLLTNTEPIRIANASTSQVGQTDTITYIPGTTMRGIIINELALYDETFNTIKKDLFSNKVCYLNAYLAKQENGKFLEFIPSPKGFYEDKTENNGEKKKIKNVVIDGEVEAGYKRASLGRYCKIQDDCIYFSNLELGNDMRINTGDEAKKEPRNIFRNEYIAENHIFCGYIAVEEEELCKRIKTILERDSISIGSSRSSGYGKCKILEVNLIEEEPYEELIAKNDQEGYCYLYLVSHLTMCNEYGELVGLDIPSLQKAMGVEDLEVQYCSTSTIDVKGYNRSWKSKTPSAVMYEMGSVFKLKYSGTLKKGNIDILCHDGIGVRRNEGFGRVLILENYEFIQYKKKWEETTAAAKKTAVTQKLSNDDKQVLKIAAKGYYLEILEYAKNRYIVNHPLKKGTITPSQLGTIQAYAALLKYTPEEAKKTLLNYLEHAVDKDNALRKQSNRQKRTPIKEFVINLFESDLDQWLELDCVSTIMGIDKKRLLSDQEVLKFKIQLLIDMIHYDNRKKGENYG